MELADKYVHKIWEKQSFSEAAKELYISQPSLSSTVARLERSLGFRIFNRSTLPLSLTPQGRIYMDFLEETMVSESNMRQRILSMGDTAYGNLSVGGQIYAALHLIPKICGQFYRLCPQIGVTIDIGNTGSMDNLLEKMKKGMLDIVLTYDFDEKEFEGIPLLEERLVFVMHKDTPSAKEIAKYAIDRESIINKTYTEKDEIEDFSIFDSIKFVKNRESSNTTQRMTKILGDYKVAPYVIINVKQIEIFYNLMLSGIGAVMVSDLLIANSLESAEDLLYFLPKSPHSHRTLYMIKRKNTPLSPAAERFVSVALEVCSEKTTHADT